jgi:hypothetical protein
MIPRMQKPPARRTAGVLALFGLFVVAVLAVLVRRAFPGSAARTLERRLRRRD